jgi:cytochrome c oxidase cbb3-type subunit 1
MSYTAVSLQGSFQSLRAWQEITHFTQYTIAHSHLGVYAFATMILFGATYYIMPRVMEWEWESPRLVSIHFWTTGLGIGIYITALFIGGVIQGLQLLDPDVAFLQIVEDLKPWFWVRSVGGTLMTIGHFVFAYLLYRIIMRQGSPQTGPTYFRPAPKDMFGTRQTKPAPTIDEQPGL